MTVSVAGQVELLRTDTSNPMTWSHNTGTTSPEGVVVMIMHGASSTDHVTGVTYGSAVLDRIQRNVDTATEPGAAEIWFKGNDIPTGTQTVTVTLSSGTTDDILARSYTLDGAGNLEIVDRQGRDENAAADPTVFTMLYGGRTCMSFCCCYSGVTANTTLTVEAASTKDGTTDLTGNFTAGFQHQTTAGSSNFGIQWGGVGSDDLAMCAIAVSEVQHLPLRAGTWM